MDETVKKCQHVRDHVCGFQGEPTIEDCLFCLPCSAINSYKMAMMRLGQNVRVPFGEAYMTYAYAEGAAQKAKKFGELMKEHHPEVHKRGMPKMTAVFVGPNPILDDNPLAQ